MSLSLSPLSLHVCVLAPLTYGSETPRPCTVGLNSAACPLPQNPRDEGRTEGRRKAGFHHGEKMAEARTTRGHMHMFFPKGNRYVFQEESIL